MLQEEPVFSCQNDEWGNALSCDVDAYGVKENYRSYFHLDEDNYSCKTYYVDENSGEYNGDWVDIGDLAETLRAYASDDAPAVAQSETEILGDLLYYGDVSQINMSSGHIAAFLGVLNSGDPETPAMLADGGNGIPILFYDDKIYDWDGSKLDYIQFAPLTLEESRSYTGDPVSSYSYYVRDDAIYIYFALGDKNNTEIEVYACENGVIQENLVFSATSRMSMDEYTIWNNELDASQLIPNTWGTEDIHLYDLDLGDALFGNERGEAAGYDCWWAEGRTGSGNTYNNSDWERYNNWNTASEVSAALTAMASSYSYPQVTNTTDLDAILAQLAAQLGGEIVGVYDLGNGVYYVVIDVSGTQKGGLICSYKENGKVTYRIENTYQTPETQENLDNFVANYNSQTNVVLDFNKVNSLTSTEEFVDYIQSALDNMDGLTISDSSKNELTTFMENAITSSTTVVVPAANNVVTLTPSDIANSLENAQSALETYEGLLSSESIELNKGITLIIRIIGNQLDVGEPMEVILNGELADAIGDEMLQIYLGSSNHAIQITAENLKLLIAEYGTVSVQIQCNTDGTYTVNFLDEGRTIIEKMVAPVTVFLPCDHEFFTVMARYGTQIDNWGGQFSSVDNTISFSTPYTGIYELLDNSQTINDIGNLPAETQAEEDVEEKSNTLAIVLISMAAFGLVATPTAMFLPKFLKKIKK